MRILLTLSVAAVSVLAMQGCRNISAHPDKPEAVHAFKPLPYPYDALEPHIDAETMEIHYDRHHRAYFNNFIKAVEGTELARKPFEEIFSRMSGYPTAVRNNGGGVYNHDLFWTVLSPEGGGAPQGPLADAINSTFGSFEDFKKTFESAAMTRFGSGWAWLCVDQQGKLFVSSTPNQDNPLMDVVDQKGLPILALDVWEHAYYLKYQNRRGSYVEAFWNVVHWPTVAKLYQNSLEKVRE